MALKTLKDIPLLSGGESLAGHAGAFQTDRLGLFQRAASEGGDLCRLRFFNKSALVVSSPSLLHEMLVDKARSFSKSIGVRTILYPLVGDGLFSSSGERWRRHRKLMSPLFTAAYMESYTQGMSACIERGIGAWRDGEVIDLGREMTRITMSVVGKALFDADTFDEADALGGAITTILEYISEASGSFGAIVKIQLADALEGLAGRAPPSIEGARARLLGVLRRPLSLPTAKSRRVRAATKALDALVLRMINERRGVGLGRPDLLSKLLAARDEDDGATMTDQEVRDEVMTLFFAGHETTAIAMTWAFYLLSRHPEIYQRHKDEVDALGGRPITFSDLVRLPYTLRVFKETLRLYPPAFILDRQTIVDEEIGGYALPKDTILFFSPYAIQRRADLFPDPETFDPDRFTKEAEADRQQRGQSLAYVPFGAGPRVCIGIHFALVEAQLVLAELTQRFTLTAVSKQPVPPMTAGTLRPKATIFMQARARKDAPSAEAIRA